MNEELQELRAEYNRLCQRINPLDGFYSFQTERSDDGSPHVEYTDGQYHYIVTERGLELERKTTADVREIAFWMLNDLTFWMGVDHELKNRVEDRDCRRIIFSKQLELMRSADTQFAKRLEIKIADTLARNPFNDQP